MICEQPGHLIHSPSGTRLAFAFAGAIGLRAFLNHAMQGQLIKNGAQRWSLVLGSWCFVRGWSLVVPGAWSLVRFTNRNQEPGAKDAKDQARTRDQRTKDEGLFRPWHVVPRPRPHAADLFHKIVE